MTSGPTSLCESWPITDRWDSITHGFIVSWNRGQGRKVYHLVMRRGMKVHRSVKTRMLARGKDGGNRPYLPKVRCVIDGVARPLTRDEWLADDPVHFEWTD